MGQVDIRPAGLRIDALEDVLRHVCLRVDVRDAAVGVALQPVQVAVARRTEQALRGGPVLLEIHQHRGIRLIPVPRIVLVVLEIALDLTGVAIERERGGRVQIVARPLITEPRRSVAGAPIDHVGVGIVVAGHPGGAAAGLPGVRLLPGVTARLARRGNAVGLPHRLAGLGVERLDEATHAELTAGNADQHPALHDQRGHRHVVAGLPVLDRRLPGDLAGLRVERDQHGFQRREVDLVAVQCHAAAGVVQRAEPLRQLALVAPEQVARGRIERQHLTVRRADEHNPVVHDRGGFVA